MDTATNLRYIQYARKSSEAKEKQALSIPDQIAECEEYATKNGLNIVKRLREEKSAFKPNKREQFDELIRLIEEQKADAILTWKPDRLCRNPKEGGILLQLLQDGLIKEIRTPLGDIYNSEGDTLILQIHFGMANQYSRNISQNVKRAMKRKVGERKEYPFPALLGYDGVGDRGSRNIRPSPLEAPFIIKAFDMAKSGLHSLQQIADTLNGEGFRTKKGKEIGKSHLVRILTQPAYYGYYKFKGELCDGNYEPLITKGLFDLVQEKLKDRTRPKRVVWERDFASLIKCGVCGCAITTTIKRKYLKKTKEWVDFIYHHCTHRRGDCEEQSVTDINLKEMLYNELNKITIDLEVWQLSLKLVHAKYEAEYEKNKRHLQLVHQKQEDQRDYISSLIKMRANNEITPEEFLAEKNKATNGLATLENLAKDEEHSLKTWLELMEDYYNTVLNLKETVEKGTPEEKQKVLTKVGKNFLMKRQELDFTFKKPYDALLKTAYRSDWLLPVDSNHQPSP